MFLLSAAQGLATGQNRCYTKSLFASSSSQFSRGNFAVSSEYCRPSRFDFSRPLSIVGVVLVAAGTFALTTMGGRILQTDRRIEEIERDIDKMMLTKQQGYQTVRADGAIWFEKPYELVDRYGRHVGGRTERVLFYDLSKEEKEQADLRTMQSFWISWLWMGAVPLGLGIVVVGLDTLMHWGERSSAPATSHELFANTATRDDVADSDAMPESLGALLQKRG
jgi:hypothetical protein